jgi:hypothetical protein
MLFDKSFSFKKTFIYSPQSEPQVLGFHFLNETPGRQKIRSEELY